MRNRVVRTLLDILPKRALTEGMGWLAERRPPEAVMQFAIKRFSQIYRIDLSEISEPLSAYKSFDAFFTRGLADGIREIDEAPDALVSPCDGAWGASGIIENLTLCQIKGRYYSLAELLASHEKARQFEGGSFITIYLSPRDYHRVHFPCDGDVLEVRHIPGDLYPVNPPSVRNVERLFSRNERLIVELKTEQGPVAVVMVGATCVAKMTQNFDPALPEFPRDRDENRVYHGGFPVERGQELGTFHLGSTVVMAFAKNAVELPMQAYGERVLMGQRIAGLNL